MCEYCGDKTDEQRKSLKADAEMVADRLERMAGHYRALARGQEKPHTDQSKRYGDLATSIVRRLVADYV